MAVLFRYVKGFMNNLFGGRETEVGSRKSGDGSWKVGVMVGSWGMGDGLVFYGVVGFLDGFYFPAAYFYFPCCSLKKEGSGVERSLYGIVSSSDGVSEWLDGVVGCSDGVVSSTDGVVR